MKEQTAPRRMTNVSRNVHLAQAYDLSVRQNELYYAMLTVERCGASPELTKAITDLGERMQHIQRELETAIYESIRWDGVDANKG